MLENTEFKGNKDGEVEDKLQVTADELHRQQTIIDALLEGYRAVLRLEDFESSARAIFDSCKRLTGATAGYIALLTGDRTENEALFLDTGEASCTVDPALPMPVRGLREAVYQTGKTLYENDFSGSEWELLLPSGHTRIANVLFAPLEVKRITVGLLGLANKPGGFTEYDAYLASGFGELASVALLNSRSMETLQSSEERFRSVAQSANDAIITVNSAGYIIFWNKAAEDIFGYRSEETVGKTLDFIMPEQYRARHQKAMERVVSTGDSRIVGETVEMAGLNKDGCEFPIELSLASWKFKEEIFFTGIIRDITERKHAAEAIQSLARFPSENRNPVLRVALDGTILYANDASSPLLSHWASQAGQNIPDPWRQLTTESIKSGAGFRSEITCGERTFSLDFAPVVEAGYVNVYGLDITEIKQADALLVSRNQFITSIFESLAHPFYVVDANDYTIKMANQATYPGKMPDGITCYELIHRENIPCSENNLHCLLEEVKKTKRPAIAEHVHHLISGEVSASEVHAYPIFDSQGNVSQIIEYSLDISERKRMEEELKDRTHQLDERVKELNCLYGIEGLVKEPGASIEEIIQGTAELIPPSWQYPESTGARIILEGQVFSTENFKESAPWRQTADIIAKGQHVGTVEVCCLDEKPESDEGPFLTEERYLINSIAERLAKFIEAEWAEEALRQSEERWRSLTETSPDHILTLDTDLKIQFANSASPGLTVEELIGKPIVDFVEEERQTEIEAILEDVLKTGTPAQYETIYHTLDGGDIYYESRVSARVMPAGNEVVGLTLSARDITERKQAEEALRQANDKLELRVQERTAELVAANKKLYAEIAKRKRAHEAERKAREIAETLRDASHALTLTLNLDEILNTLLEYLYRLVPYDSAIVFLPKDEMHLMARTIRDDEGWRDPELTFGSPLSIADNSNILEIYTTQSSVTVADTRQQPGRFAFPGGDHLLNWLGVPLVTDGKVIGLCSLEKSEPGFFTEEHRQLAEALVGQAAVAFQNAWLFEQVRAGRERLQSLSRQLVEIQEAERRYIARELHDEAGQVLASLKVGLRLLERDVDRPKAILTGVADLSNMVDDVQENLHRLAIDLRPVSLDHLGLEAALRQYLEDISDKHGLLAQFEVVGVDDRLSHDYEIALYRIVQEAVTNVIRHARATRVDVLLKQRGDRLVVIVEDNGVGFDPAIAGLGNHMGLFGMRERAEMLGGKMTVECTAGVGTTILVEVPHVPSVTHHR